jgi:hypothetical protein
MQDAAEDPPVVRSFLAPYVGRQVRLDLPPLLVAQSIQI